VTGMHSWNECIERAAGSAGIRWRAALEGRGGAFEALPALGAVVPSDLLIGPEGGFTDSELGDLASRGWPLWSLGVRAVRVETAAIVAAARLLAP